MFFKKAVAGKSGSVSEIEKKQIDLIYGNRLNAIIAMSLGVVLLYYTIRQQLDHIYLYTWVIIILCVDAFRLVTTLYHLYQKKNHPDPDYHLAKVLLFTGTILSAVAWGSIGLFVLPLLNEQGFIITAMLVVAIATGSTTTLSYIYGLAMIFVVLVIGPLMIGMAHTDLFAYQEVIIMEVVSLVMVLFLFKNTRLSYENNLHMLQMKQESDEREKEFYLQRERAEQANLAKSAFLANMSHELRTPMHAILGFSDLGSSKVGKVTDEKLSGYFTRINDSGKRLLSLLNGLLDLSKLEAGRMKFELGEHDMLETIEVVIDEFVPLFNKHGLTVDLYSQQNSSFAEYDDEKMIQVVRNLLSNAIKFTPDNKALKIYLDNGKLPSVDSLELAVPALSVSIKDQGPGIPEDELDTIFDKFVQSSNTGDGSGGTGLGLSISKEIINHHHGVINVVNNDDGGATFTFIIPCEQPALEMDDVVE